MGPAGEDWCPLFSPGLNWNRLNPAAFAPRVVGTSIRGVLFIGQVD